MTTPKPKHTPTPQDKTAKLLESAWIAYADFFGGPPSGTLTQLRAMLCLKGGKDVVRAVNRDHLFEEMRNLIIEMQDEIIEVYENDLGCEHGVNVCRCEPRALVESADSLLQKIAEAEK